MGGLSSASCRPGKKREVKILLIGLDSVGKTTILYQLKLGQLVTTIPTFGFNLESIKHRSVNFVTWDLVIMDNKLTSRSHYYESTEAVVFVIDSSDLDRYGEAKKMLEETILNDELKEVPIAILANKQDLCDVMTKEEIISDLITSKLLVGRKWAVFAVSGVEGAGLRDSLDWLERVV